MIVSFEGKHHHIPFDNTMPCIHIKWIIIIKEKSENILYYSVLGKTHILAPIVHSTYTRTDTHGVRL